MLKRALMRRQIGFTLLQVVALVAIVSILAAAALPSLNGYLTRKKAEATAQILVDLETGVKAMKTTASLTLYPFRISHLGRPVTINDTTSCSGIGPAIKTGGGAYLYTSNGSSSGNGTPAVNQQGNLPFFRRTTAITGFPTPLGTVIDTIYRTSAQGVAGTLPLTIRAMSYEDAMELNLVVDAGDANNGDRSNSSGKVIWSAPVNELVDVKYLITPMSATTC
jgi:type II secretory pathway pseudopilin PulG